MRKFWKNSERKALLLIFTIAIALRFLHFPENIYFGFDQARDAFEAQNIYKNLDLKIIGPSTAAEGLFHGPLYWYLIGPFYLLAGGNPAFPAAFLLFLNAAGVFLVFILAKTLFNKMVGFLAALLFAFSFEQTQYAMYFGNPGPAVLTVLLFYLGLAVLIFKKDWRGLPLSLIGMGLSVQSEFFLIYLSVILVVVLLYFRRQVFGLLNGKKLLVSLLFFALSVLPFIIADLKFGARNVKHLIGLFSLGGNSDFASLNLYVRSLTRLLHDNFLALGEKMGLLVLLMISFVWIYRKKEGYLKIIFLLTWFFSSSLLLAFGQPNLYYTNVGIGAGLLILGSYFLRAILNKAPRVAVLLLVLILASNLFLIMEQNPKGVINDIYVQEGMLLGREKQAIDYIYQEAEGRPIVVSAMTMPLKVNTTWAYLFDWYGKGKYGRLPYWAGEAAEGYPGQGLLARWQSQEEDYQFFSIIEPRRGIREPFVQQFLEEQAQYGRVVEEKVWGEKWYNQLVIQKRE